MPCHRPAFVPALCLLCVALAVLVGRAHAAVVAAVTAHGPPKTPAVVTAAAYLNSETDVLDTPGWMRALYGVQFDEDERRCASKDEVLYRPLRQCFVLFRRGPCARKQWLVFDKAQAARGVLTVVCAPRRCAPNWGFNAATGRCFEHSKCRTPLAFHYTLFGEGVCRCNGTTGGLAHAPPDDPASCRKLYHKEPCRKGQMLAPRYRLIEGMDAMCFRDPCDGYIPPPAPPRNASALTTPVPLVKPHTHTRPHDHRGDYHPQHRPPQAWRALQPGGPPPQPAHPQGRAPFDSDEQSEGEDYFDVEVLTERNRPDLGVRASTHALVGSSNNNPSASVNGRAHDHVGQESAHVQRARPLNFTISLKPMSTEGGRRWRRDVPDSWLGSRAARSARGEANSWVGSGRGGRGPRGEANPEAKGEPYQDAAASAQRSERLLQQSSGAANMTDDYYVLEVQYSDGNTSCMSPTQLNVICDLHMLPLFSDYSDVKVPICVNALFRFAIGRVGKSDECAENDKGECAKTVVVKSVEPLDWELE